MKNKVDIGELKELLKAQPDLTPTLAVAQKIVLTPTDNLGDFASIIILGTEETSPEMIILKKELISFAEAVLEKLK